MGRKVHIKKMRSREQYLTAKQLGRPTMMNTQNGPVLLNVMKHFCLKKPYKNQEYQALMLYQVKSMRDNFVKAQNDKAKEIQEGVKNGH